MPFLLPDPRTDDPHLHFVMLRILRHPPPLSSVFTCDQLAAPSPDRPAPTAVQFYVRPRGGVQTWDEGQAARLRAMLVASVQRRHPKGLKVHVHSVDRFGCLAALTRVLKAANLSVTRAKVRARKEFGVGVWQSGRIGAAPAVAFLQRNADDLRPFPATTFLLRHRPVSVREGVTQTSNRTAALVCEHLHTPVVSNP